MALNPSTRYPGQIDASDPTGYPYGKAKNQTTLGDGTGTPFEKDLVNDIFGFQQALLSEAGITPSGTADAANASEYMEALYTLFGLKVDGGELVYVDSAGTPTPKSRTIFIDPYNAMRSGWDNAVQFAIDFAAIGSSASTDVARFPISSWLPDGAEITGLRVLVDPDSTGVMTATLYSNAAGSSTGYPNATSVATASSSGATEQWIDLGVISSTIDKSTKVHHLRVKAGQANDRLYGYEITFNDPGPRNA